MSSVNVDPDLSSSSKRSRRSEGNGVSLVPGLAILVISVVVAGMLGLYSWASSMSGTASDPVPSALVVLGLAGIGLGLALIAWGFLANRRDGS